MRKINFLFILIGFWLASCSPKVTSNITKSAGAFDYKQEIQVYGLTDPEPAQAEQLGTVKIGDTGFTMNCTFEVVVELAKLEARKAGGNAIKIIEHLPPTALGSSCHRIVAKVLKVNQSNSLTKTVKADSSLAHADYAVLHFYRFGGPGAIVTYDIHLGDSVLCRSKNNSWKTVRVKKEGLNTLWSITEAKVEIPINIKLGQEYYIRSSVTMGAFVGRPKLELVSNETGRLEFPSIKLKRNEMVDKLIFKDGRELPCLVQRQDDETVYFKCIKKGSVIETLTKKTEIKELIIAE